MATCGNCGGSGLVKIGEKACSNCGGQGEYTVDLPNGTIIAVTGGRCGRSGSQDITDTCTVCGGTGRTASESLSKAGWFCKEAGPTYRTAIASQRCMRPHMSWAVVADTFQHLTDRLGKTVDEGILETVIALNVLGIETSASCEGHLDHGVAAPWIDIEARAGQEQSREVARLFSRARAEQERLIVPQQEIDALFADAHQEQNRVKRCHLAQRSILLDVLARFYLSRQVPYDVRLVILSRDTTGRARVESQGADFQSVMPEDVRAQRLRAYQAEMQVFTAFLKDEIAHG